MENKKLLIVILCSFLLASMQNFFSSNVSLMGSNALLPSYLIIYWNDYSHHSLGNYIDLQCSFDSKKYDKEIVDVTMKENVKFRALHSFSCN